MTFSRHKCTKNILSIKNGQPWKQNVNEQLWNYNGNVWQTILWVGQIFLHLVESNRCSLHTNFSYLFNNNKAELLHTTKRVHGEHQET